MLETHTYIDTQQQIWRFDIEKTNNPLVKLTTYKLDMNHETTKLSFYDVFTYDEARWGITNKMAALNAKRYYKELD